MSGIFTLGQVGRKQDRGNWDTVSNVFLTEKREPIASTYGYAGGGADTSLIFRINFASDSTEAPARSRLAKADNWHCSSVANKNYGYWNGNYPGDSRVERLDFANDTVVNTVVGNLTRNLFGSAPVHNLDYGYFAGGGNTAAKTTVDRIDFGNDTAISLVRGPLAVASEWALGGTGNQSYGYVAGGSGDTAPTTMNRIDYANDSSAATPKGPLSVARGRTKAIGNSAYGYWGGGGSPNTSVVDRLDFSSDTTTMAPKGNLPVAARGHNTTGHHNSGYFCSGNPGPSNNARLDYDNDTVSPVQRGYLAGGTYMGSGTGSRTCGRPIMTNNYSSAGVPYGYFAGGDEPGAPGQVSKIDRLDYDNDTATMLHKGNIIGALEQCAAWSTLDNFYSTNGNGNKVLRLSYMNDTATTSERGTFTSTGLGRSGVMQNTNYAYIYGGPNPSGISTIQRIDFANDGGGSVPRGPLTGGIYAAGGHSNQSYGYSMGGYVPFASPARKSWVQRLDFANDTATAPVRGNLPAEYSAGTGSSTLAYGYHSGGGPAATTIYRIDFSTDTTAATPKGPLSPGGHGGYAGATSNDTSYGYWAGGNPGMSTTDRLDFSSDTTQATTKGPLSAGRRWVWEGASSSKEAVLQGGMTSHTFGQTSSSTTSNDPGKIESYLTGQDWDYSALDQLSISSGYGYFMGGGNPGSISTIDRIDFGNDTADAVVKGNLSHISRRIGAFTSLNYGYRCGGYNAGTSAAITDIERLDYTNDTGTLGDAGYLTVARHFGAGLSTKDYGYLGGGEDPSSVVTIVDRLDFSTDITTAVAKGPLTVARKGTGAVMSADYGYWGGGTDPSGVKSTVDRIDFASDTTACVTKGPLTEAKAYVSGTNSADFGYVGGGYQPSSPYPRSTVDKIDFSNDTRTAIVRGPLTAAKYNGGSTGNESYGYWGGGATPSMVSTVDRVDYSNDTLDAVAKGPLTVAKGEGFAGTSNRALTSQRKLKGLTNVISEIQGPLYSNTTNYGYFGGGGFSSIGSVVDRVDYSNDTLIAVAKGSLNTVRHQFSATGNESYAYWAGGETPSEVSSIDRFDYSSDSSVMAPKGPLSAIWFGTGSAGNSSYGYFAGGRAGGPYKTTVHRIDYSNDLVTAAIKGPITSARYHLTATGNTSYGWFGNGGNPSPGPVSTVDRIDYSNDTPTASPRGPLTLSILARAATGNADYGYWGGGHPSKSTVDRVDFASDTGTAPTKGPLTVAKGWRAATGNLSHGYWGGGSPGEYSAVDRIQYSSDTATSVVKGPLTLARGALAAASPKANALPQSYTSTAVYSNGTSFGGYNGAGLYAKTQIERMDYSNDSVDPIIKANFNRRIELNNGAVSNLTSGYWIGGGYDSNGAPPGSSIYRLDYANDTNVMTVGNRIDDDKSAGAFGNKNYGYTGGNDAKMERLDYANDFAGTLQRSTGNSTAHERGATASADYGYYNDSSYQSRISRLDFANDTVAASERSHLSYAIGGRSSATGNVNYGWYFGSGPTTVNRVDYSNDTATALVRGYLQTTSPVSATYASGHGNENYGYVQGYYNTNIQRIDYANDMATPITRGQSKLIYGGAMSSGTSCRENSLSLYTIGQTTKDWQFAASGPEQVLTATVAAYFVGGESPGYEKIVQRINYANDTATAMLKGSVPVNIKYAGGVSSQSYAYVAGNSPSKSDIYRLDYSNDADAMAPKGNISGNRDKVAGIGNLNYGYFGGGNPGPVTTVDRVDYSSDTGTTPSKGPLVTARAYTDAVGNLSYGYFGGGTPGPGYGDSTHVERLDYSSDTDTTVAKGPLHTGRFAPQGTGNADYGYLAAGHPSTSSIDRIDYSNDTPTASPKGPLHRTARYGGSTGNKDFGYFTSGDHGDNPSPSTSEVYRLDYANDTNVSVSKGPLAVAQDRMAAASAAESGFPQ